MYLLELTLESSASNVALDEALLDEAARWPEGVLRVWEPKRELVVAGRSSKLEQEIDLARCHAEGVEVVRRSSGGAAIVTGPGCLMYGVVLGYEQHPELRNVTRAHQFVLGRIVESLAQRLEGVTWQGTSDLTYRGRKFSGNSLRCRRDHMLYHGTLLYDFRLARIGELLGRPPREPEYRAGRAHDEFVANLPLSGALLREALIEAWDAREPIVDWPR